MKSKIKQLLKKTVAFFGYELIEVKSTVPEIISNVFNTSHSKIALLSYVKCVFTNPENRNDTTHTNRYTTFLIAEALSDLGYNVDVIDCGEELIGDFLKYDLVIGLGKTLDYVLKNRSSSQKTKVIWFGTGCNPLFSNVATLKRLNDFYKRHNLLLFSSTRYIKEDWPLQHEFSDWIILHGSTFAKSTYETEKISTINAPVFICHSFDRTFEEWNVAKKNYLWFGVGGLVHKGLDLLLDSFKDLKNVNLHICGNIEVEQEFFKFSEQIISSNKNIIYHGFVDVRSKKFEEVLRSCAFIIFPSASEGNSPSVITCMANGGLIPIVPASADVDLNGYGIRIEELSVNGIIESVAQSQMIEIEELKNQRAKIITRARMYNTFDYFKQNFKLKLNEVVNII